MRMRKRRRSYSGVALPIFVQMPFIAFWVVVILFPFLYMISTSFQTTRELFGYPPTFIPESFSLDNYRSVFRAIPFGRVFLNSVIVAACQVLGHLLFDSITGFALAKLRFPGRNVFFAIILATMMVPGQAMLIPLYILMTQLGWVDTYWALIIPVNIISAFGIFLMRQFISTLPASVIESARMDGARYLRIYWSIVLPMSKAALLSLSILTFTWSWQSFAWPLVVTRSMNMRVVLVGLTILMGEYVSDWNLILAGAVMAMLPVVVFYIAFQRRIVEGVTLTGMK